MHSALHGSDQAWQAQCEDMLVRGHVCICMSDHSFKHYTESLFIQYTCAKRCNPVVCQDAAILSPFLVTV